MGMKFTRCVPAKRVLTVGVRSPSMSNRVYAKVLARHLPVGHLLAGHKLATDICPQERVRVSVWVWVRARVRVTVSASNSLTGKCHASICPMRKSPVDKCPRFVK
ncbi:unnamed protein product [Sphagnum balticum]